MQSKFLHAYRPCSKRLEFLTANCKLILPTLSPQDSIDLFLESLSDGLPIHNRPNCLEIVGFDILILQSDQNFGDIT
jgi:hypothetical protein